MACFVKMFPKIAMSYEFKGTFSIKFNIQLGYPQSDTRRTCDERKAKLHGDLKNCKQK